MSPRTRAVIFVVITLAWWALGIYSMVHRHWLIGSVDFVAGVVTLAFAYRSLRPRRAAPGGGSSQGGSNKGGSNKDVKPLRAPRPRK